MAAGTRTRNPLRKTDETATPRRSTRRGKASQENVEVPGVFRDLLEGEVERMSSSDADERPLKRRKTRKHEEEIELIPVSPPQKKTPMRPKPPQPRPHSPVPDKQTQDEAENNDRIRQTIIDSDESDESDMEWEDALAEDNDTDEEHEPEPEIGDVAITYGDDDGGEKTSTKRKVRRRAITSVDKKRRLDVHKMHILCLLYHVHRRNAWCNDRRVQANLRRILSPKLLSNLVPNPEFSQYQASKQFSDGLGELKLMWSKRFTVTAKGMYKPRWAEVDADIPPLSEFDELDDPMDLDEFRSLAVKLQGSQDVGAQLFCALLRAIGIEARLVCSLQVLPFASSAQPATPPKPSSAKKVVVLDPYNTQTQAASPSRPRARGAASRMKRPSRLEQALGESHPKLSAAPKPTKKYHTPYPVYWVEVFNASYQKWMPIDVLSTFTVNAPEKLEPPLSFSQNSLTYAIAFDEDYTAKEVTQRYAKAFNAKTRRFRVESTPQGEQWWKRTMKFFERSRPLDRDQVEDAALARKTAGEGIPKNVQDFKNHPVYVLERHVRHNQVIHPKSQVGKVNVGTAFNPKMELIYRRGNVHTVRSADKWYRLGRDVRDDEQPLKHAKPKPTRRLSIGPDDDDDESLQQEQVGVALYAEFQTEIYIPPPVVRGRVPRNAYGNLDLYVPSMCPPGGTHIRHKLASKAARVLGVDFAEAVTGFNFKGRHGTAVVQGVVVAREYADAVDAAIDAMIYASEAAEEEQRRVEALRLWRRFYLGLRIAQRVNAIEIEGETGPVVDVREEVEREDRRIKETAFAGGFFPDEGEVVEPTAGRQGPAVAEQEYGGGFLPGRDADEDEDEDVDADVDEDVDDEDGIGEGQSPPNANKDAHPPSLHHEDSLGSAILSQVKLLPQRTNSVGGGGFFLEEGDFEDDEDEEEDGDEGGGGGGFVRDKSQTIAGPSSHSYSHSSKVNESVPAANPPIERNTSKDQPCPSASASASASPSTPHEEQKNITSVSAGAGAEARSSLSASPPASSPLSDAGSLPLEDPDDEDAEPEWLVDVT